MAYEAYGIYVAGLPLAYVMVVQLMSFAIGAYCVYRLINSDVRLLGAGVPHYARAAVASHGLGRGLDGFPIGHTSAVKATRSLHT